MDDKILEKGALGGFRGSVGHKAGGFIAKKKFHPGSMVNQEKLWLAREEIRKQREAGEERQRRREEDVAEEARLEELFNLTGKSERKRPLDDLPIEQRRTLDETNRRLEKLKMAKLTELAAPPEPAGAALVGSHSEVWGSWFDRDTGKWGYACCKKTDKTDFTCLSCLLFCLLF